MGQAAEGCAKHDTIWRKVKPARTGILCRTRYYGLSQYGLGTARWVAKLAKQVRLNLPGYREHIEELIEADNEVVVRLTITGTHPRNGEEVSVRDVTILTVEDGRITRQPGLTGHLSL